MSSVINGTPLQENSTMYIHARTAFTQIYAVDVNENRDGSTRIANQFVQFAQDNHFVNTVCERTGIVNASSDPIHPTLQQYTVHSDFSITPVTVPNLILVFGLHAELCVTDHVEYLKQRFPHAQILILSDLCVYVQPVDYFVFNYCLRVKHADMVNSENLIILNED